MAAMDTLDMAPPPPAAFTSPAAILYLPQGPASPFFYGRAVLLPGPALVTLFGAQQAEQNDCVFLHGLGDTVYDVGLLSEGGALECVVEGVTASGGDLARRCTAGGVAGRGEGCGGGGGGESGNGGDGDGGGGGGGDGDGDGGESSGCGAAPAPGLGLLPAAAGLLFQPASFAVGAAAAGAVAKYFPEAAGGGGEGLVVYGELRAGGCVWRPQRRGGVAALLARARGEA